MIKLTIILGLLTFVSYAIGRASHILGGNLKTPHHWIYGLALIILGIVFIRNFWGIFTVAIGIGLFISDLRDFLELKVYGVDDVGEKKFWGID